MAIIDSDMNLYKTPSNEILQHRKEFYGLWKRCDDKPALWLKRVRSQIERCDFPPMISREFLLIDKFVCELNDDEREFIRKENTWTVGELTEHFANRKESIVILDANAMTLVDRPIHYERRIPSTSLLSPPMVTIKCELVSNVKQFNFFVPSYSNSSNVSI